MKYYLPANKIVIECTNHMWLHFKDVVYEQQGTVELIGVSMSEHPKCFLVKDISYKYAIASFDDYEEAYKCFLNEVETHAILHSSKQGPY